MRGLGAGTVLVAVVVGLPWLLIDITGSPIPDRVPNWNEIVSALSHRDDGTLLLAAVRYFTWVCWAVWVWLVLIEAVSRIAGRPAPHIPGLQGPQHLAAVLVVGLGAAIVGTSASLSRAVALPAPPGHIAASTAPPHTAPGSENPFGDVASIATAPGPNDVIPAAPPAASRIPTPTGPAPGLPSASTARPGDHDESATRRTVHFGFGSAQLTPAASRALGTVADDIRRHADPRSAVVIEGHTDAKGSAAYNQHLSVLRAHTVRDALKHTVDHPYQFNASGKGETEPVATETRPDGSDDPAARARNRRVDITYSLLRPSQHQPAPTAPAPTATAPSTPAPSTRSPIIELPSGAVVGLAFAAGVSAGVAVARLRRQRRYLPRPPAPGVPPPGPVPEPGPVVSRILRAHRTAQQTDTAGTPDTEPAPDSGLASTGAESTGAEGRESDSRAARTPPPKSTRAPAGGGTAAAAVPMALAESGQIDLPIDLTAHAGLGLAGPGGPDGARAIVSMLLLGRRRGAEIEIVLPRADAVALLGPAGSHAERGDIAGLVVTPTLNDALVRVQADILHRARLCQDIDDTDTTPDHSDVLDQEGVDVFEAYRKAHPDHVLPTVVLAATVEADATDLLHGVLSAGHRYAISAVLIGEWLYGASADIDADGHVTATSPALAHFRGSRLFGLTAPDVNDILDLLTTANDNTADTAADDNVEAPTMAAPEEAGEQHAPSLPGHVSTPRREAGPAFQRRSRPITLEVLGPVRIHAAGRAINRGVRRAAFEVLAHLAAHPDGLTQDRLLDDLWPDQPVDKANHRLHDAVYSLRSTLRPLIGATAETLITREGRRYQLDPGAVDVDLWHFTDAYARAGREDDEHARLAAYEECARAYTGEFAGDIDGEWAEALRETLRHRALDVLSGIADLSSDPERALAALDEAADIAPYDEAIHRRRITLLADLGRIDAAERVHDLFERRLADHLDASPDPETEQVVQRLRHRRTTTAKQT